MGLFGNKHRGQPYWHDPKPTKGKSVPNGYRFSIKGSPRYYSDIKRIIESDPGAEVYFSEALTYERGAGVALWRISATTFDWLPSLYDWWAEAERIEPIESTFHLYMPNEQKYAALDMRQHGPDEVETYIRQHAPTSDRSARALARRI